jgi:carboxylesterase
MILLMKKKVKKPFLKNQKRFLVLVLLGVVLCIGAFSPPPAYVITPNPSQSFTESLVRIQTLQRMETKEINPKCKTTLLTPEVPTDKVIVFLHGFTNCPEQFKQLGQQFVDKGYIVFIPRLPHHGYADRMTNALQNFDDEESITFTTEVLDLGYYCTKLSSSKSTPICCYARSSLCKALS